MEQPNKGKYGCAASAKPRLGKFAPKNLMPEQKRAQKPNDRASFHDLVTYLLKIFNFGTLFYKILHIFLSKIAKNLTSRQNLPTKT